MNPSGQHILVVGIGNELRKDDGIGPDFIREFKDVLKTAGADVVAVEGRTFRLIQLWNGCRAVFLIDAVHSGGAPGTIYRFDALKEKIPEEWFSFSTHQFGLTRLIELSRTLGGLPENLIIYGIAGQDFSFGQGLSVAVLSAAKKVAKQIRKEIEEFCKTAVPSEAKK